MYNVVIHQKVTIMEFVKTIETKCLQKQEKNVKNVFFDYI